MNAAQYLWNSVYLKQILFLFVILSGNLLRGQALNVKLANQYYEEKQFQRALSLYEELSDRDPADVFFYDRLLDCYLQTDNGEKALKMVKKRQKKFSGFQYKVDEGFVQEKMGKLKQAEQVYAHIVNGLGSEYSLYLQANAAFQKRNLIPYAIQVLEKAEHVFEGYSELSSDLAKLYMMAGDREKGLEKYVLMVINAGLPYDQAKQLFEMNITDSIDFVALQSILLKNIQKYPEQYELADLLKWTFIKQRNWEQAFIQTRALDKRLNEKGQRMIDLGELCISNEEWDMAARCFEYVKSLGSGNPYYDFAVAGLLESRFNYLENVGSSKREDWVELEKGYKEFLILSGPSDFSFRLLKNLAKMYTRFLHEPGNAVQVLEDFVNAPGINAKVLAEAKLELGDAYVIDGDVWTSELLYAQVEKDFPEEALGQEAKFRRARLSYFRGDFDWSNLQLNVLKAATTQLISNNAIELSLTISENLGLDSNYDALERYSEAGLLLMQNKFDDAWQALDSIVKLYPGHSLSDDILYSKGQIYEAQSRWTEALNMYNTLAIAFSHDILADNAWYRMARIYEFRLKDPVNAKKMYEKIIFDFPGSIFSVEARKNYRRLRGDNI